MAQKETDWQRSLGPERQDYLTAINEIKYSGIAGNAAEAELVKKLNSMVAGLTKLAESKTP